MYGQSRDPVCSGTLEPPFPVSANCCSTGTWAGAGGSCHQRIRLRCGQVVSTEKVPALRLKRIHLNVSEDPGLHVRGFLCFPIAGLTICTVGIGRSLLELRTSHSQSQILSSISLDGNLRRCAAWAAASRIGELQAAVLKMPLSTCQCARRIG